MYILPVVHLPNFLLFLIISYRSSFLFYYQETDIIAINSLSGEKLGVNAHKGSYIPYHSNHIAGRFGEFTTMILVRTV